MAQQVHDIEPTPEEKVLGILRKHLHYNDVACNLFIVWSCYILGNRKYLIGNGINHTYYEVTYNKEKNEWYIDEYTKVKNTLIKDDYE